MKKMKYLVKNLDNKIQKNIGVNVVRCKIHKKTSFSKNSCTKKNKKMHVVKYQFLFWSISDYVIGERIDDQPEEKKGKKEIG
jgi:hypothetical protein